MLPLLSILGANSYMRILFGHLDFVIKKIMTSHVSVISLSFGQKFQNKFHQIVFNLSLDRDFLTKGNLWFIYKAAFERKTKNKKKDEIKTILILRLRLKSLMS